MFTLYSPDASLELLERVQRFSIFKQFVAYSFYNYDEFPNKHHSTCNFPAFSHLGELSRKGIQGFST